MQPRCSSRNFPFFRPFFFCFSSLLTSIFQFNTNHLLGKEHPLGTCRITYDKRISPALSDAPVISKTPNKSKESNNKSQRGRPKRTRTPTAKKLEQEITESLLKKGKLKQASERDIENSMSSARRQPRSGARAGLHDSGEEQQMWKQLYPQVLQLGAAEVKAKELKDRIVELEAKMKEKQNAGTKPSDEEWDTLDSLYREQVKIAEEQKAFLAEHKSNMEEKLSILIGVVRHNEEAAEAPPAAGRSGNSRSSAMEFEGGPSDSPGPSTAENRHVRKVGAGRTSSQPPRASDSVKGDATPVEVAERPGNKPKIVFAVREEVAFKRKIPGKMDEQDWIQGIVTRVIGEGKSRRYDVQDPFPEGAATKPGEFTYKSSASQMVPIPPPGTPLGDYEVGKAVLALYPETTTFYRAEVKAMLDGGAYVQLLFEDEAAGALKIVERRMVLDHKG